jgi:hypothetical protein
VICFRCEDQRQRALAVNRIRRRGWSKRLMCVPDRADSLSPRDWLLHLVLHAELHVPLICLGFLDAHEDGGIIFWRWDPWNATMRPQLWRALWMRWKWRKGRGYARGGCPPSF